MMFFLGLVKDSMESKLESPSLIWGTIQKMLRSAFYTVNTIIYTFFATLYKVFELLCNGRLMQMEEFELLAKRSGILLGVIMLFRVIFEFLKVLVDPDKTADAQKVVKRIFLAIVMLGVSSFVFEALYYAQYYVIKSHVLYKYFVPYDNIEVNEAAFGNVLAARVFSSY